MIGSTARLGLGLAAAQQANLTSLRCAHLVYNGIPRFASQRTISSIALSSSSRLCRSPTKYGLLAAIPPPTSTPSSFFTPSLCRYRNASTITSPSASASASASASSSTSSSTTSVPVSVLDWNNFFRLRTSRRRYSLASSVITSMASTVGMIYTLSVNPELQDWINKTLNLDLFVSLGLTTFAALLAGWLIGPVFGNGLWRLLNRSRMPEFSVKERAFFERVKRHRVNPSGASANNPVPDFYGEKVGSVQGYRRWLKDQRAFNRKRGLNYSSTI